MEKDDFEKTRKAQEFEQASALVADTYPPVWRRMYNNCKNEGFDDRQSMKLVMVHILSMCPFGIRGTDA